MTGLRFADGLRRKALISFRFNGREFQVPDGENLAAALYAEGCAVLRGGCDGRGPRGAFCFMGICQECLVEIDGRRIEACRVKVRDGLVVKGLS